MTNEELGRTAYEEHERDNPRKIEWEYLSRTERERWVRVAQAIVIALED